MNKIKNPLIGDTADVTMDNCADVLKFIEFSMYREEAGEDVNIPEGAREGLFKVMDAMRGALDYESDRIAAARKPAAA